MVIRPLVGVGKHRVFGCHRLRFHLRTRIVCCQWLPAVHQNKRAITNGNHYDTLGVQKDAKPSEIKDAYIEKTKQHHPDAKTSANSDDFLKVSEAYKVLSNSSLRAQYDIQQFGKSSDFNRFETGEYNLPNKDSPRRRRRWEEGKMETEQRSSEPVFDESVKMALSGNARLVLDYLIGGLATICIAMYLISRYQRRKHNSEEDSND